jgi:hypothetical protein
MRSLDNLFRAHGDDVFKKLDGFDLVHQRILVRLKDYLPDADGNAFGRVIEALGQKEFKTAMKRAFTDWDDATDFILSDSQMRMKEWRQLFIANGDERFPDFAYVRRAADGTYALRGIGSAKGHWDWAAFRADLTAVIDDTKSLIEAFPNAEGFFVTSKDTLTSLKAAASKSGSRAKTMMDLLDDAEWEAGAAADFRATFAYFRNPPVIA